MQISDWLAGTTLGFPQPCNIHETDVADVEVVEGHIVANGGAAIQKRLHALLNCLNVLRHNGSHTPESIRDLVTSIGV